MNTSHSERSAPLYLRFFNYCDKSVDIIWVNHEGRYHTFSTLKPQDYVDVNTFTKHYWKFKETQSGNPLVANNKLCFCGEEVGFQPYRPEARKRHIVVISRPIVTKLRTMCINFLSNGENALKQCSDVKYLEIPVTLKKEIVQKIHARDSHLHATAEDLRNCESNLIHWSD